MSKKNFQWMVKTGESAATKTRHSGPDSSYLSHLSLSHL